jgi:hypothetical protein
MRDQAVSKGGARAEDFTEFIKNDVISSNYRKALQFIYLELQCRTDSISIILKLF